MPELLDSYDQIIKSWDTIAESAKAVSEIMDLIERSGLLAAVGVQVVTLQDRWPILRKNIQAVTATMEAIKRGDLEGVQGDARAIAEGFLPAILDPYGRVVAAIARPKVLGALDTFIASLRAKLTGGQVAGSTGAELPMLTEEEFAALQEWLKTLPKKAE